MNNGLLFKGFYVSGKEDPTVFNGKKYYKVEFSDGRNAYPGVRVGSDASGQSRFDSLEEFEVLYDGIFRYSRGNLELVDIMPSKLTDPVVGLSVDGLRCSVIPDYVSEKDGKLYYNAMFSDGSKSFTILLGSDDQGKKLKDSLKVRAMYQGTVIYLQTQKGNFLLAQELQAKAPVKK